MRDAARRLHLSRFMKMHPIFFAAAILAPFDLATATNVIQFPSAHAGRSIQTCLNFFTLQPKAAFKTWSLNAMHGSHVFNAGKAARMETVAPGTRARDLGFDMFALMAELPKANHSPNGRFLVVARQGARPDAIVLDVFDLRAVPPSMHSLEIPGISWARFFYISPSGEHLFVSSGDSSRTALVSLKSGRILLEISPFKGEEFNGVGARFSASGRYLTIKRRGFVELYRLESDSAVREGQYDLGSRDRIAAGEEAGLPVILDGLADAYYLEGSHSLAAFYFGPEPTIIELKGAAGYRAHFFDGGPLEAQRSQHVSKSAPPPTGEAGSDWVLRNAHSISAALSAPKYSLASSVSASGKYLAINRMEGSGETSRNWVDLFSLPDRRFAREIPIGFYISAVAISPNNRWLAVAGNNGFEIYDVENALGIPRVRIDMKLYDGSRLAFVDDRTIIAGSGNMDFYLRWDLSDALPVGN